MTRSVPRPVLSAADCVVRDGRRGTRSLNRMPCARTAASQQQWVLARPGHRRWPRSTFEVKGFVYSTCSRELECCPKLGSLLVRLVWSPSSCMETPINVGILGRTRPRCSKAPRRVLPTFGGWQHRAPASVIGLCKTKGHEALPLKEVEIVGNQLVLDTGGLPRWQSLLPGQVGFGVLAADPSSIGRGLCGGPYVCLWLVTR